MKKWIALFLLVVLVAGTALFAGGKKESAEGYVFASDATWPPLEFIDENGNLTGFEVELIPLIASKVGATMTVKNIPWDTIFAGLANGAYDAIASGDHRDRRSESDDGFLHDDSGSGTSGHHPCRRPRKV